MNSFIRPLQLVKGKSIPLGLATRIVAASLLTFIVCHIFALKQSEWAILTAIIVMQSSVGASLKATLDRFAGSIGGAFWGVCVLLTIPHATPQAIGLALVITLIPLALVAAFKPSYRVAPITGIILLLIPSLEGPDILLTGLDRILEVGVGSIIAVLVSLVILPVRAHETLAKTAGGALGLMAELGDQLSERLAGRGDPQATVDLHQDIRRAITRAEGVAEEVSRERMSYVTNAPDPQPVCRTLRRLRNDLTMIGRAMDQPFHDAAVASLEHTAEQAAAEIAAYLRASATALARREKAPSRQEVDRALAAHASAMAQAREIGAIRALPDDLLGRIFGLAFGFRQLSGDLDDLTARVDEYAGHKPNMRGETVAG